MSRISNSFQNFKVRSPDFLKFLSQRIGSLNGSQLHVGCFTVTLPLIPPSIFRDIGSCACPKSH
jgi:hypothetical protein